MTVNLDGLCADRPLGFLAALGVLRVMDGAARKAQTLPPKLGWRDTGGSWLATLEGPASLDVVVAAVEADRRATLDGCLFQFAYPKEEKTGVKWVSSLRPPVGVLRLFLRRWTNAGHAEAAADLGALVSEAAWDPVGEDDQADPAVLKQRLEEGEDVRVEGLRRACSPPPLDFTSRNVQFLDQVRLIGEALSPETILAELTRWQGAPSQRVMGWDSGADRPGALYLPSTGVGHPVAEWLAFRGTRLVPVRPTRRRAEAVACRGARKSGSMVWPAWEGGLSVPVVTSLLGWPKLESLSAAERRELGVGAVYEAELTKGEDGYQGIFGPTRVV